MDNTKELTVISFCAGYGGIERGLDLAGVKHRVIAYVEIEAFAIANLVAKMEAGELAPAPIYTDLKTFPASYFRGKVDIFTGGYPCQPFSVAGKGLGKDDPRHLWPYLLEHIKAVKPVRCLWENVTGHIHRGLEEVIADLEGEGYDTTWGIFSAAEVGAKHRRERIFILADTCGRRYRQKDEEVQSRGDSAIPCGKHMADSIGVRELQQERGIENVRGRATHSSQQIPDSKRERPAKVPTVGGLTGDQMLMCESEAGRARGNEWPPEPAVGRVAHGTTHRVDRLRMLGNGVVPQTACRAWQVLTRRFSNE